MQLFFSVQIASHILPGHLTLSFTLHLHTCCLFSDTLPPCLMFSQPLQTHPFNPLQPLSKYFPLGAPGCLLLPPFVYCLLPQSLSIEIRGGPPTLSQAKFPHCKQWKWQLSSLGWSAYLSLGKPSGEDSRPCWDGLSTRPRGNNGQRLLCWKEENNLNFETDYLSSAF